MLLLLAIYSYTLIDLNLTLVNTPLWNVFRNIIIQIGYFKRDVSWILYLSFISLLFVFHAYFTKNFKKWNILEIAFTISVVLLLSYPFLSHDFFNYIFDAKIVTFYHQNPYLLRALDFPNDPWLRFMHWTHRTYPYGPVFLILSLIPSFISAGKLFMAYFFFKLFFISAYFICVYYLLKIDKKIAVFFATHPLVIMEGIISSHNDLIAVSLAFIGIFYYLQKDRIRSTIFLLFSGGIKFITLPLLLIPVKLRSLIEEKKIALVFTVIVVAVGYISLTGEIQPWYFLNLLIFLPFFEPLLNDFSLFFYGLLLSYYPFIRLGAWDNPEKVQLKHQIIAGFFVANLLFLFVKKINRYFSHSTA
jgi:hypothetical protein